MRTTLDLPVDLIQKAQKLSRAKTKTETIIMALKAFVRLQKVDALIALRGKIPLKIDIDKARGRT